VDLTRSNTGLVRVEDGVATIEPHVHQWRAWNSEARFVFIFAGTQGGKTSFLPWWLNREIDRTADPNGENDYLAVTSSFDLFKLKFLPEMRRVFEMLTRRGKYWSGTKIIELSDPDGNFWAKTADSMMWGRIILRSAQAEGGLESTSAKAAVLDECGQDEFRVTEWEAVQRRLSLAEGRVLAGTTLYNRGWVKTEIYDRWKAGDTDYDVIQFPSYENPSFPRAEYDRMERTLPRWKLNMFYRGEFDVPEGLIYDNFDSDRHTIAPFPIPDDWPRFAGLDFGGVHLAAVLLAEDPATKVLYLIDEYIEGKRTIAHHAGEFIRWRVRLAFGGAPSEDQWRMDFGAAGFPIILPTTKDVEIGIDRVYGTVAENGLVIFKTCHRTIDEFGTYSRETDRSGVVTQKIKAKETFHMLDSVRYIVGSIRQKHGKVKVRRLG
jgi:hypothetical protein